MGQEDDVLESSSDDDRKTIDPMTEAEKEKETMKLVSAAKGGSGTSIAERRAAKCGFNAERINLARIRTTSPLTRTPPCLTIPPGISPTALLDSPIMLLNYQALPSPTTGTFPLPCFNQESSTLDSDGGKGRDMISTFQFNPNYEHTKSSPVYSSSENQGTGVDYHDLVFEHSPMDFQFPEEFPGKTTSKYYAADRLSTEVEVSNNEGQNLNSVNLQIYSTDHLMNEKTHLYSREPVHHEEDNEITNQVLEGSQPNSYQSMMGMGRTLEDGYNWRKYGQKQVKGSECPRSYYKCTNPNCQVKKKVERSHDGQITEIIYKGAHNHAKPAHNRRAAVGSSFSSDHEMSAETGDNSNGTYVKVEGGSTWMNFQSAATDHMKLGSDIGLERTSSTSVVTELSDPLSAQGVSLGVFESTETPELSSTLASHNDDDEDGATQGSTLLGDDEKESESKRRKTESCLTETNLASRAVREPRVVVQIESDVDILDDGYRWRKYGQKVVKGNPNPRSYYKCTSAGCIVRKHVERASHNLKFVITTYEGKHNHEVPAAKNSNHINSSTSNVPPSGNAPQTRTLPRNSVILKHEIQDLAPQFDRKLDFSNEYLRPSFPGNYSNDMKYGLSSIYQMKHPLQGFNTFGLNPNSNATQQATSIGQLDFPMTLPMSLPALVGFDFNNAKSFSSIQSLLSRQQFQENDTRFLRPKQEQEDDNLYDACLPILENANPSSVSPPSSLIYNRLMGSFPS